MAPPLRSATLLLLVYPATSEIFHRAFTEASSLSRSIFRRVLRSSTTKRGWGFVCYAETFVFWQLGHPLKDASDPRMRYPRWNAESGKHDKGSRYRNQLFENVFLIRKNASREELNNSQGGSFSIPTTVNVTTCDILASPRGGKCQIPQVPLQGTRVATPPAQRDPVAKCTDFHASTRG